MAERLLIKRAYPKQAAVLRELQLACLPGDVPLDYGDAHDWWFVLRGTEPVAFAAGKVCDSYTYYLSRAGVLPSARGTGLQARLIRVRLRAAVGYDCTWAVSDTSNDNAASMRSLIRCGFRPFVPASPWALPRSVYWRMPCKPAQQRT